MSNVVPLRSRQPSRRTESIEAAPAAARYCRVCSLLRWTAGALFGIVCFSVFIVLLTLRRPIQFFLGLGTAGGMLGLLMIAIGFTGPAKSHLLWMAGGITAVCACGSWFYDVLLLRLSPEPIILT